MRIFKNLVHATFALGLVTLAACQFQDAEKPFISSTSLQNTINNGSLLKHSKALEDIAYNTPNRNRVVGSKGHNDTVTYLYNQLTALGGYYNVSLQPWTARIWRNGSAVLIVNGKNISAVVAQYSPSGGLRTGLVLVNNSGCNSTDFPSKVAGNVALISRGNCTFFDKSALARKAGAAAAVIYNDVAGQIRGLNLGADNSTADRVVPTIGISRANGLDLVQKLSNSSSVGATFNVRSFIESIPTYNVLAETVEGDPNNIIMVGAHTDSVAAGPGINDDGSGTVGILEVARQLSNFSIENKVRFGWWSGEEEGLLGSKYYVKNLTAAELRKVKAYLNFDMIASPNYQFGIYDGDGGDFNITGPQGSGDIETLFQDFYRGKDLNYTSVPFDGRSDYDPFIKVGIPAGGVVTGAEKNKTQEGAAEFGGTAGIAFDPNYHSSRDTVANLNFEAFLINAKAIAHSVATYAESFDSLNTAPGNSGSFPKRRSLIRREMSHSRFPTA